MRGREGDGGEAVQGTGARLLLPPGDTLGGEGWG